jgi:putative transposase
VLDPIFWIVRTGAPWRDLPAGIGDWNSVCCRFRRWTVSGLCDRCCKPWPTAAVTQTSYK